MSGPFGSSQFMYQTEGEAEEGQSLRFEASLNPYLSLTPSSAGNQDVWTFSAWVKRGDRHDYQYPTIFAAGTTTTDRFLFRFSADKLDVFWRDANTTNRNLTTNALYRDCSAWYHVVLAVDTTDATTANRMRLYVNGDEVTSFSADSRSTLSSGSTLAVNDAVLHTIGTRAYSLGNYYDGYIANACFIDGQQLDPTSFGEYKDTLWKPKSDAAVQALTFGTNGWYLNFADTTSLTTLGDDTSGNGNDWTTSGMTLDVVPSGDSPVLGGNFCVLDPNYTYNNGDGLSYGNLVHYDTTAGWTSAAGTFSVSSGKWYYEYGVANVDNSTTFLLSGWAKIGSGNVVSNLTYYPGSTATSYGLFTTGTKYTNSVGTAGYASAQVNGDVVGVALDLDAGTLTFYVNGVSQGVAYSGLSGEYFPVMGTYGGIALMNFGQDGFFSGNKTPQGNTDANGLGDFYHTVPTDHLALVSANLPTPTITAPDDYFNTVLWTGTGSVQSVTGVGFQPDLLWTKARNATYSHVWYDAVRGLPSGSTNTDLIGDTADTENTYGLAYVNLASFDTDGFTTGTTTSTDVFNTSGTSQVSWCWLGNNGTVSNTSGSLTSTVSANQTAGFSVATYTNAASGAQTVGHGLNSEPEMVIVKIRNGISDWFVYHRELGNTKAIFLNLTSGPSTNSGYWNNTSPTSSVFSLGTTWNSATATSVAYCFHSVEGYSICSSYTGNGSADGTFLYCGFRPAYLIVKRTDATSAGWVVVDSKRNTHNVVDANLFPTANLVENSTTGFLDADFLANGVKLRTSNGASNDSGVVYIFYAVAEAPFKSANAR